MDYIPGECVVLGLVVFSNVIYFIIYDILGGAHCIRVWSQPHTKLVHAAIIVVAPIKLQHL